MKLIQTLINSLEMKGRKFLQLAGVPLDLELDEHDVLVPICHLRPYNLADIQKHLLSLNAQDRNFRFGYAAIDEHITTYVGPLNFDRTDIYGIFTRYLQIPPVAILACPTPLHADYNQHISAEFGVSGHAWARGRG